MKPRRTFTASESQKTPRQPNVGDYIRQTIQPGEDLYAVANIHWAIFIAPFLWGAFFFWLLWSMLEKSSIVTIFPVFAVLLFVPILIPLNAWLYQRTTETGITSSRVLLKTGLFRRITDEIAISKVEAVGVNQGLFGRLAGFGTVVVQGTGGNKLILRGISDPMAFRATLQAVAMPRQ